MGRQNITEDSQQHVTLIPILPSSYAVEQFKIFRPCHESSQSICFKYIVQNDISDTFTKQTNL